jgi:ketosteroid isomerase-like protein
MKLTVAAAVIAAGLLLMAPASSLAGGGPTEIVDAYHLALTSGDEAGARAMLSENLVLYEDGVAELSLKEYGKKHLKADIKFSMKAKRELVRRDSWASGDTATVSSMYKVKGKSRGRTLRIDSTETMTLELMDDGWKIVHIHWSNHVRK